MKNPHTKTFDFQLISRVDSAQKHTCTTSNNIRCGLVRLRSNREEWLVCRYSLFASWNVTQMFSGIWESSCTQSRARLSKMNRLGTDRTASPESSEETQGRDVDDLDRKRAMLIFTGLLIWRCHCDLSSTVQHSISFHWQIVSVSPFQNSTTGTSDVSQLQ